MSAKYWPFCSCLHVLQLSVFYSLAPGRSRFNLILKVLSSILFYWLVSSDLMIMPSDECHGTYLKISQHWFRQWLGAVRQQAITWANVDPDLCRHMASLGHNLSLLSAGAFIAWYCYAQSIISNWLSSWCNQSLLNLFSSTWIVYLLKNKIFNSILLLNPSYWWLSVRLQ